MIFDPPRYKGTRILTPGVAGHPLRKGDPIFHTTIVPGFRTLRPGAFLTPFFYHGAHKGAEGRAKPIVLEYEIVRVPRLLNLDSVKTGKRPLWNKLETQTTLKKTANPWYPEDRKKRLWNTQVAMAMTAHRDELPFDGWVDRGELMLLEPSRFLRFKKRHTAYIRRTGFKYEAAPNRFWDTRQIRMALEGVFSRSSPR
jgi:hypothetical protein